ncbi:hypothetical protein G7054_g13764 [Neopestalotiopsis clavispora]|nr:hypothetical protein G7054_g13764 [Neopestalotiopsis clavispora]
MNLEEGIEVIDLRGIPDDEGPEMAAAIRRAVDQAVWERPSSPLTALPSAPSDTKSLTPSTVVLSVVKMTTLSLRLCISSASISQEMDALANMALPEVTPYSNSLELLARKIAKSPVYTAAVELFLRSYKKGEDVLLVVFNQATQPGRDRKQLSNEKTIATGDLHPGQVCSLVFEVADDKSRHPDPYFVVPDVGMYEHYDEASCMAVSLVAYYQDRRGAIAIEGLSYIPAKAWSQEFSTF